MSLFSIALNPSLPVPSTSPFAIAPPPLSSWYSLAACCVLLSRSRCLAVSVPRRLPCSVCYTGRPLLAAYSACPSLLHRSRCLAVSVPRRLPCSVCYTGRPLLAAYSACHSLLRRCPFPLPRRLPCSICHTGRPLLAAYSACPSLLCHVFRFLVSSPCLDFGGDGV